MNLRYNNTPPEKEISQIYSETMEEMFQEDSKVVYLDADLMGSLKTSDLWKRYPNNVFNTGIQEANMVGVACGMYLAGYIPYIHSFAPFASRRVFDQIYVSAAYAKKKIRIIGSDAGIMATYNGGTHMCFEDVAMMRAIPDICIVDVSDGMMFRYLLSSLKNYDGIVYYRIARRGLSDIYMQGEEFEPGKGKILIDGTDATVIASGVQVAIALQAADMLKKQGINIRVVDIVTIKPIDRELIVKCAKETGLIITTENHNVEGGLGDAVASITAAEYPIPVYKNGIQDIFGQVGGEEYLREIYKIRSIDIVELVKEAYKKKS